MPQARHRRLYHAALFLLFATAFGCESDEPAPFVGTPVVESCIFLNRFVHIDGIVDTPGNSRRSAEHRGFLYVADGASGIQIIDLRSHGFPIVGTVATGDDALGVRVVDALLLVAQDSRFDIFDIHNPAQPVFLGGRAAPGRVLGMDVQGDNVFLADDVVGLQILDIGDPSTPTVIGGENTPGIPQDVVVRGDYAFMSDATLGLRVVFVGIPAGADTVATLSLSGTPSGMVLRNDDAYIAAGSGGIHIIDLSDPTAPVLRETVPLAGITTDVTVAGQRLYAARGQLGVGVFRFDANGGLDLLTTVDVPGVSIGVDVSGGRVFASNDDAGIEIIHIGNQNPPPVLAILDTPGNGRGAFFVGSAVYVCDGPSGIQVIDVSDPEAPLIAATLSGFNAQQLVVKDSLAFVATGSAPTGIIDISDPFSPNTIGSLAAGTRIALLDSLLLLASGSNLLIYNANMTPPVFQDNVSIAGFALDVTGFGDHAFLAAGFADIQIVNISDPTFPFYAGSGSADGSALGITAYRDFLLVATTVGMEIIDASGAPALSHVATVALPDGALWIATEREMAYVAAQRSGIHVIDLRNLMQPRIVGTVSTAGRARGVAADPFFMFATDDMGTLLVTKAHCIFPRVGRPQF